ncbi:hypothetical protein MSG28_006573 [Choristoneura fumiferana]|uniref:Uncharacterized protein n=1 Tax=Choristoneura fumiferana TaxID=7141 RepID=A0ACC0JFC7_CHOFU|nr:hypothetical protein MSG28_006573 [Choristoneura fumiferana]
MDGSEDMDPEDEESHDPQGSLGSTTTKILKMALALNRLEPEAVAALDPIEATKERPRILDDNGLTKMERAQLRREAYAHIATVLKTSKCLLPQPRWLSVRQLAPSADTHYLPPCVKLHRCAPDSGCCSEANICAPIDGHYVTIPLILDKVGNLKTVARMQFFNHTRCECVSRESLESPRARQHRRGTTAPPPTSTHATPRVTVQGAVGNPRLMDLTTQEPKPDNESTAPPQLRSVGRGLRVRLRLGGPGAQPRLSLSRARPRALRPAGQSVRRARQLQPAGLRLRNVREEPRPVSIEKVQAATL